MAVGSASKVARWRRCKHACWYSDVMSLAPIAKSIAPIRGNIIHACLENFYAGKDWTIPIQELKVDLDNVFDEEREEWGNLPQELYRILRAYIIHYRPIDAKWKVLATEYNFAYTLNSAHTYTGYIDMVVMDENKDVWIVDHKTVKAIPDERDLYMDLQLMMYYDAVKQDAELMKKIDAEGGRVAGFIFNHIKTKAPREPQVLKNGGLSKAAIDTDVRTYFETIKKHGLNPADYEDMIPKLEKNVYFKRTRLPVNQRTIGIIKAEIIATLDEYDDYVNEFVKETDKPKFTRNMLKQRCNWDCSYQRLCYGELAGMNINDIIASDYETKTGRDAVEEGDETDGQ